MGFLADHEGQTLKGARPESEEGSVQQVEGGGVGGRGQSSGFGLGGSV